MGAEIVADGVSFRVWAPDHRRVAVVIDGADVALDDEANGYFSGIVDGAGAGTRYRLRLDDDGDAWPDPASRFQPDGPHGDSEVIDPSSFVWSHDGGAGPDPKNLVIYEMHIGTFTQEGTWRAAMEHLPALRDTGINMLEVMPVHEFPGRFGWGYDGVDIWAPSHLYGSADDLRAFVDAAHAASLFVILDVVYNHLGPDGCYLSKFTSKYFTKKYVNDWGEPINFDDDGSPGVREFFSENAAYWIDEFHLDGLRLDATQSINDDSPDHVLALIARKAREAAPQRQVFIVAENEPQDVALVTRYGIDAMWNDDWHHAAMVGGGRPREAYYTDYRGTPQEFVSMAKHGFLYQGQRYSWQEDRRGTPSLGLPAEKLVCFLQNHDQIANSATGERLVHPALTALLLLAPQTPMLFQGQEFAASTPFLYFADHKPELAKAVAAGRREFMEQFPSVHSVPPPEAWETFSRCKLDHREREKHADAVAFHRELLQLRPQMPPLTDGAVLSERAFLLRFTGVLLLINLGDAVALDIAPEPLLAPPAGKRWKTWWSSVREAQVESNDGEWKLPAESAVLLKSE